MRNSISRIYLTIVLCFILMQVGLSCTIFNINVPAKACINTPVPISASGLKTPGCFDDFTQSITIKKSQPGSAPVIKQLDNVGNNVTITFDQPGKYIILYTFRDGLSCAGGGLCEGEKEIEIIEPSGAFAMNTRQVCKGDTFSLRLNFENGATRATVENKDKTFKVAVENVNDSGKGTLDYNLAVTQDFKLYISRAENALFQCANENLMDSILILAKDPPEAILIDTICDATNENYSLRFKLQGVGSGFELSPESFSEGVLKGDTLITNLRPSGEGYNISINTGTVCKVLDVVGVSQCKCAIIAGEMPLAPTFGCESGEITLEHDASKLIKRAGDNLLFVLHDGKSDTLENIIDIRETPTFRIPSSEFADSQLYVSAVLGPYSIENFDINASACRNITFGTPVQWYGKDSFSIVGKLDVCANETNRLYEVHLTNDTLRQPSTQAWVLGDGSGATITDQNDKRIFLNFLNNNSSLLKYESTFKPSDSLSCITTDSILINVDNAVSAPAEHEIILWPGDIFASTASEDNCFQWGKIPKKGNVFKREVIPGANGKFFFSENQIVQSELDQNVYFVAVYKSNNCEFSFDNCNSIIFYNSGGVLPGLSVGETDDFSMEVMPNPNDGDFRLELNGSYRGRYNIQVINDIGQRVQNQNLDKLYNTAIVDMELRNLNKGLYFILITNELGKREIIKTVIAK